jgi:hypothetical protein
MEAATAPDHRPTRIKHSQAVPLLPCAATCQKYLQLPRVLPLVLPVVLPMALLMYSTT